MKLVIQRVKKAQVDIEGETKGKIGNGLLVFLGVANDDDETICDKYIKKLVNMRIFEDEEGKTNLNIGQVKGEFLVISQFTLLASCKKGNRPSFVAAGEPKKAEILYDYFIESLKRQGYIVEAGSFGADMEVSLINDGPFTIVLEL